MICVVFVLMKACAASTLVSKSPTVAWRETRQRRERVSEDNKKRLELNSGRVRASCAHSDFPHGGLQALHGRIDVPLKGETAFELEADKED